MKWAVEIQKTSLQRRNLSDLLQGIGFNLVEGIEFLALVSPSINACEKAADAFEIAKDVRAALKGPSNIDPEFILGSVIDFSMDPPHRHAFIEVDSCVIKINSGPATVTISPPSGLSPVELAKWHEEQEERNYQAKLEHQRALFEPAYLSPKAAKAIELLCIESPSGETLYKIYELAEGHPNPNNRAAFHAELGIDKEEFNRFKDAVHNPSVSGDWARHAYHGKLNSSNPMTKLEAEQFVRGIAEKWLDSIRRNQ